MVVMMFIFLYSEDPEVTRTHTFYHFATYTFPRLVYSFYISLNPKLQDTCQVAHISLFPIMLYLWVVSIGVCEASRCFLVKIIQAYFYYLTALIRGLPEGQPKSIKFFSDF